MHPVIIRDSTTNNNNIFYVQYIILWFVLQSYFIGGPFLVLANLAVTEEPCSWEHKESGRRSSFLEVKYICDNL